MNYLLIPPYADAGFGVGQRLVFPNIMHIGSVYRVSKYHTGNFSGELLSNPAWNATPSMTFKVIHVETGSLHPGDIVEINGNFAQFQVIKQIYPDDIYVFGMDPRDA